jgi:hypothetical protein
MPDPVSPDMGGIRDADDGAAGAALTGRGPTACADAHAAVAAAVAGEAEAEAAAEEARADQLARWHADDHPLEFDLTAGCEERDAHADRVDDGGDDVDALGGGWSR